MKFEIKFAILTIVVGVVGGLELDFIVKFIFIFEHHAVGDVWVINEGVVGAYGPETHVSILVYGGSSGINHNFQRQHVS